MRVVILGSGGREHALAFALSRDSEVEEILLMPGNAGMEKTQKVTLLPVLLDVGPGLVRLIKSLEPDLVIIGPEAPLCEGLVDLLTEAKILTLGPTKSCALLEGSKSFSKDFMRENGIATADYQVFTSAEEAKEFVRSRPWGGRLVIKASELAAGKGVFVTDDLKEQLRLVDDLLENPKFFVQSQEIVIEQRLTGDELSVIALCDGEDFLLMGEARDHKRLLDGDQGPNTGGMGCYSSFDIISESMREKIMERAIAPVLEGMKKRGQSFKGFLFAGLMIDGEEFKVLEYNVRFGDPEAQTLLPLLNGSLGQVFMSAAKGKLKNTKNLLERLKDHYAVHVVMASENYPGIDGRPLLLNQGLSCEESLLTHRLKDTFFFSAGLKKNGDGLVNSGGRVLGVTAIGESYEAARSKAYENLKKIHFKGAFYRKDIAEREIK